MSDQPPVPPSTPPHQPSNQPPEGIPPTQPMAAASAGPPVGPSAAPAPVYPPKANRWQQATSTSGRRWALGISAVAVAFLLILGVGVTSIVVLRGHDRVSLLGNRQDGRSFDQNGPGNGNGKGKAFGNRNGQGPGSNQGKVPRDLRGMPGMPGGQAQDLGGLGDLMGGGALHGEVTANVAGSVQALVFQRGEVTALSDTSITLKSSDGFVGTYGRTAATTSRGAALVKGGQALVLARASDKAAITTLALPATAGALPNS